MKCQVMDRNGIWAVYTLANTVSLLSATLTMCVRVMPSWVELFWSKYAVVVLTMALLLRLLSGPIIHQSKPLAGGYCVVN